MEIIYISSNRSRVNDLKKQHPTFLAIGWDKWDDYSYKTLLPCTFFVQGEEVEISGIRILIKDSNFTAALLDEIQKQGWDGKFPIPGKDYASVPSDVNFYEVIAAKTDIETARKAAVQLKDASYLSNISKDTNVEELIKTEGFQNSLLREGGSRKAFLDGFRLFLNDSTSSIGDFTLYIPAAERPTLDVEFKFNSNLLPYDINILIGPNGIGKSHCLQLLTEYWLGIGRGKRDGKNTTPRFNIEPNIRKLILISYSPFEDFIIDLTDTDLEDKGVYQYFGFRKQTVDESGAQRIGISRNLPASDSARSIIKCLTEDEQFSFLPSWVNKFASANSVLSEAIEFDSMALVLKKNSPDAIKTLFGWSSNSQDHIATTANTTYLKINAESIDQLKLEHLDDCINATDGVIFLKDDQPVTLSSGQRLFSYMVINVLGALKNNSLVVVDEPELFLHPNLEITFISLLKNVLKKFKSKCILATHSLVATREVPSKCVHVFRKTEDSRQVVHPPFETFGGDIQRISSYVFGDKSISKPHTTWIEQGLATHGSADALIEALGSEINEELLMKIKNIARVQ